LEIPAGNGQELPSKNRAGHYWDETLEAYTYDPASNLTRIDAWSAADLEYDPADKLLRVGDVGLRYDERGNLVEHANGTRYHYDGESQLVRIDFRDGKYAAYRYDTLGRRVEKEINGEVRRYIYDGIHLLAEYDGAGRLRARYVYGSGVDNVLAMWRDGHWYYFVTDHLGSVRALLSPDGRVVESYRYTAYGLPQRSGSAESPAGATPSSAFSTLHPFGFAGREYDTESGLYFMRSRYYDPQAGRFIQRDKIGLAGDLNLYAYAEGDPVNQRDPFGLTTSKKDQQWDWCDWKWEKPVKWTGHVLGDIAIHRAHHNAKHGTQEAWRRARSIANRAFRQAMSGTPRPWQLHNSRAHKAWDLLKASRAPLARWFPPGVSRVLALAFHVVGYVAYFIQAYQFFQHPTLAGLAQLWISAALFVLFFGIAFGPAAVGVALVSGLLVAGGIIALVINPTLAFTLPWPFAGFLFALGILYGILNADPTFVQPPQRDPPPTVLSREPLFFGTRGLTPPGRQWSPHAPEVHLFDGSGRFLTSVRLGSEDEAEAARRASTVEFAVLASNAEVLRQVIVDLDPPAVELTVLPEASAKPGRLGLRLSAHDPHLHEVIVRATREQNANNWWEVLRLQPPVKNEVVLLDVHRFPADGPYVVEALARDLAGNDHAARVRVVVPEVTNRPLAVYDLSTKVHTEVRDLEIQQELEAQAAQASGVAPGRTVMPPATGQSRVLADVKPAWVAGKLPPGAQVIGDWSWHNTPTFGAPRSHAGPVAAGPSLHYFIRATEPLILEPHDNLVQYVYLDSGATPREILLQLYTEGEQGDHRVYWGENLIDLGGTPGTGSLFYAGPLPQAGAWVRLRVPVERLGLERARVTGMLYGHYDGLAFWGPTTRSLRHLDDAPEGLTIAARSADALPYVIDAEVTFHLSADADTRVWVESPTGEPVAQLLEGFLPAGPHRLLWDGRAADGRLLPDGPYPVIVEARAAAAAGRAQQPVRATTLVGLSTLVARIVLPAEGSIVRATVPFFGVAAGRNFDRYALDYGAGPHPTAWTVFGGWHGPEVVNYPPLALDHRRTVYGNLGSIDAGAGENDGLNGLYTFRLRAWNKAGHMAEDRVRLWAGRVASNAGDALINSPDRGMALYVPGLALRRPFHLFSITAADADLRQQCIEAAATLGARIVSGPYELRPAGFRFAQAARLGFPVPAGNEVLPTDVFKPAIYTYDPTGRSWRRLPGQERVAGHRRQDKL
jgi:RHS repeat-associated protein